MTTATESSPKDIVLSSSNTTGIYHAPFAPLSSELAALTSSLLNENHQKHHIYFNDKGFHNHLVHHLLTLYALNTEVSDMRAAYDKNASYQKPLLPFDRDVVADMQKGRHNMLKYLPGDENQMKTDKEFSGKQYPDFLEFWTKEIERLGVQQVLEQWLFKGDEVGEKLFGRLFGGFIHPYIHTGFALEFHQPAIMAEALAQACVHENWVYPIIEGCRAGSAELKSNNTPSRKLGDLLVEAHNNEKLRNSPHTEDGNKLRDGVLARAPQELMHIASQWFVPTNPTWDIVNEKIAEHIHAAFLFTSTAALHTTTRPDGTQVQSEPRLDFFYIHDTNGSIFLSALAHDPTIRDTVGLENTVKLLEAKAWIDLGMYVSRGSPAITPEKLEQLRKYETRIDADKGKGWARIFERVTKLPDDDSHAVKFIRALANAEQACKPYEDRDWCVIKGDMWLRIGWLAVDSWLDGTNFVRNAGWDEAWVDVPTWKL